MNLLALCLVYIIMIIPTARAEVQNDKMDTIPIEAVISYPERLQGKEFCTDGFIKELEGGFLLYASENDYRYDTRENSVFVRDTNGEFKENYYLQVDGTIDGFCLKNLRVDDGQIVGDILLEVFNSEKIPQIPKQEGGEVEETSIYRILGNPWEYNGKHVRYEAIMGSDFYSTENTATQIMSQDGTKEGLYQEMEKKYGLEDGELRLIGTIGQARFYLTGRMSIYMGSCYGMSYLEGIELHEKDVERLDELKQKTRDFLKERFPEYYGEEE